MDKFVAGSLEIGPTYRGESEGVTDKFVIGLLSVDGVRLPHLPPPLSEPSTFIPPPHTHTPFENPDCEASKYDAFTQCWFEVGRASKTMGQH